MKKITKATLKKWDACKEGFVRFCELFPKGADLQTASKGLIVDGHKDWSDWLWSKCKDDEAYTDQTLITAGYSGTATAGDRGTATAGNCGTATAGDSGTATAGDSGTATAGDSGMLVLKHYDRDKGRYFVRSANVGENGIKPNTKYKLAEDGLTFVEVEQ